MNISILNSKTEKSILQHYTGQIQLFLYDLTCDYPFFGEWLKIALSEIVIGKRQVVILTEECNPQRLIGLTILKIDPSENKICTIRVDKDYQRLGYGTELVKKSLELLGTDCPLITVSEKHIDAFIPFFKQFGFKISGKVKSLYHNGEFEYFFNMPYVRRNVLISIKPKYVEKILRKEKTVEFRKKCFPDTVWKAFIYASSPIKKIVGYFQIDSLDTDTPENIWKRYQSKGSITKNEFDKYTAHCSKVTAIIIQKVYTYQVPMSFNAVFGETAKVPQNYFNIDNVAILKQFESNSLYERMVNSV